MIDDVTGCGCSRRRGEHDGCSEAQRLCERAVSERLAVKNTLMETNERCPAELIQDLMKLPPHGLPAATVLRRPRQHITISVRWPLPLRCFNTLQETEMVLSQQLQPRKTGQLHLQRGAAAQQLENTTERNPEGTASYMEET